MNELSKLCLGVGSVTGTEVEKDIEIMSFVECTKCGAVFSICLDKCSDNKSELCPRCGGKLFKPYGIS